MFADFPIWEVVMPFSQEVYPFTRAGIEWLAPGQYGCYGLFREGVWVYIGKGDIRARLLDHLNGDNACITRQGPTHWVGVVTVDLDEEEKRLIRAHRPTCNLRVG